MSKASLKNALNSSRLSLLGERNKKGEVHHYVVIDPHNGNKRLRRLRNALSTEPHPDWDSDEANDKENR